MRAKELSQLGEIQQLSQDYQALQERMGSMRQSEEVSKREIDSLERREREKRDRLEGARTRLEEENRQLLEKSVRLESELEFFKFYKEETGRRVDDLERAKEENVAEILRCKERAL